MHFLCLHGKGTNSKIFEIQTSAIRFELGDNHTYEFLEGAVACPINPDIQNFLSEDGEYFEYFDGSSPESGLRVVKQLEKHIAAEGPFDGVIAFSQGAAVAATLLARPLCQDASKSCLTPFKCAIFFSAVPAVDYDALSKGETRIIDNITDGELIQIPTAHIWGRKDSEWSDGSEKLSKICAADSRSVYIHDGGHEVPGLRLCDSLAETVKAIRRTVDRALFRQ